MAFGERLRLSNFDKRAGWSTRSNAREKSTNRHVHNHTFPAFRWHGRSNKLMLKWYYQCRGMKPNWSSTWLRVITGRRMWRTNNFSAIRESMGVTDIGLYWDNIHCEPKKNTPKCFWYTVYKTWPNCDKIWHISSRVNLSYRNENVFCLTWIVSLLYLVKLSIRVLHANSS